MYVTEEKIITQHQFVTQAVRHFKKKNLYKKQESQR